MNNQPKYSRPVDLGRLAIFLVPIAAFLLTLYAATAWAEPRIFGRVNLNTASAEDLMLLPGCGVVCARDIRRFREHQIFRTPRQLLHVRGIGRKRYAQMRPFIKVQGETTLRALPEL